MVGDFTLEEDGLKAFDAHLLEALRETLELITAEPGESAQPSEGFRVY